MKKYKVVYTPRAEYRIREILKQIVNDYDDELAAAKVYRKIEKRCESLSILPGISPVKLTVNELQLRFVRAGKYMVVYTADDQSRTVIIRTVIHSRQNIIAMLEAGEG